MSDKVFVGQKILIECVFRLSGVPRDPTLTTITSRSPSGVQVVQTYPTVDFIRRSEGVYEASILGTEVGIWVFRAEGAGIVDAVNEMVQEVVPSGISG
jgi:hypothetical protein